MLVPRSRGQVQAEKACGSGRPESGGQGGCGITLDLSSPRPPHLEALSEVWFTSSPAFSICEAREQRGIYRLSVAFLACAEGSSFAGLAESSLSMEESGLVVQGWMSDACRAGSVGMDE